MGTGAQLRTGGRRREDRLLTDAGTTPSRLGRVALVLLVPAVLVLPAVLVAAGFWSFRNPLGMGGLLGIVGLVYGFVLLGSMTLNAWLLLRHPHTLSQRAVPPRAAVTLMVLWSLVVVWTVLLVIGDPLSLSVWFGLAAAIVSCVSFVQAAGRRIEPLQQVPVASVELGPVARALAWLYLAIAALGLLATLYFTIVDGPASLAGGVLGGPTTLGLLVLGLPWSHPLYFVSVVLGITVAPFFGVVPTVVVALSTVANIALVSVLLFDPARRVTLVNWFFKLRPRQRPAQPIE